MLVRCYENRVELDVAICTCGLSTEEVETGDPARPNQWSSGLSEKDLISKARWSTTEKQLLKLTSGS